MTRCCVRIGAAGLDVSTLEMMSSVIPSALGRDQPRCYLSGPSFAKELLDKTPTGVVMASASIELTAKASNLFSCNRCGNPTCHTDLVQRLTHLGPSVGRRSLARRPAFLAPIAGRPVGG